ncbi:MAG: trypsin-like peptidase domain-containing protein [Desulfobacterales bacterium]|nr:trypsin-like peptidase domain-containing protein [Desulfobacterales bacterium]
MLQDIYYQYKGASMMLFRKEKDEVAFCGTAFLVHADGYLLTAAHLITGQDELMVAPMEEAAGFVSVSAESVAPISVEIRQIDRQRDIALLKFVQEIEVTMPEHIMGIPEEVPIGNTVACLGFPFGHYHIYVHLIKQAVVSAKILSGNETHILLFDTMVHDGSRGAPLINLYDGRIIGVVGGRFEPQELMPRQLKRSETPIKTNISYAVSIDHASKLMEDEALSIM